MDNQIAVFSPGARPQHLANIPAATSITDLTSGVAASFPILRMKGKVWAVTMNGATKPLTTREGYPVPAMRLVIVKANPHVSKTFYKAGYTDGDSAPPDCWSFDGKAPDVSVPTPVCGSCAACPNNQIGSRISDSGTKVKACPDVKRIAVMEPATGTLMLLRLPYTSMKSLSKHAVWLSEQNPPVAYNEILTELVFDMQKAHPEIIFKPVRWLNADEAERVAAATESPELSVILGGVGGEFHEAPAAVAPSPLGARPAPKTQAPSGPDTDEEEAPPPPPPPPPKPKATKPKAPPVDTPLAQQPTVVDGGSLEDALLAALKL